MDRLVAPGESAAEVGVPGIATGACWGMISTRSSSTGGPARPETLPESRQDLLRLVEQVPFADDLAQGGPGRDTLDRPGRHVLPGLKATAGPCG